MFSLAYTISEELQHELSHCESLRRQILLTPYGPKTELKLRFQSQVIRIADLMNFLGFPTTKNDILPFLAAPTNIKTDPARAVIAIRELQDYLWRTWTASDKTISLSTLETIANLAPEKVRVSLRTYLRKLDKPLGQLLDYLQVQHESPIILAGVAFAQVALVTNAEPVGLFLARILAYAFLFQGGYDLRGLLLLGSGQKKELTSLLDILSETRSRGNATSFLVYFTRLLASELTRLTLHLSSPPSHLDVPNSFWDLNRRQEEILRILDDPSVKITNRDVQKRFKISQISASRDLSKLASLMLIYTHGKGRSVFYAKI